MHAMIKVGHNNGGILAGIMHTGIANMLMWQRIKEERGARGSKGGGMGWRFGVVLGQWLA